MEKKIATPFLKSEAQAKQEWLGHLLDDDHVPLDVAYKATCQIQREYYPYAIYNVTCSGDWSATSIWEHVEEYQVPREETVYIDYQGREHKHSGNDREYRNGRSIDHYRRPMSRTVYDTEKRTVTDNIESTYGSVGPNAFAELIVTSDFPQLANWASHFSTEQFIEADEAYLGRFRVIPETMKSSDAERSAKSAAINDLGRVGMRDVPGNRFEDFGIDATFLNVERTDAYLAVYHVFYEYEGEKFECYLSGGLNAADFFMERKPVDDSIKTRTKTLDERISKNGFLSRKTLYLYGTVCFAISALFFPLTYGASATLTSLLWLVAAACCIIRFNMMRLTYKKAKQEKELFTSDNVFLKQQILELSQNDMISDEEKGQMIEEWLTEHSNNTNAGNDQDNTGKQSQLAKIIDIVLIIAIGAGFIFAIPAGMA